MDLRSVCPSVHASVSHISIFPIPVVLSRNVINEGCLACVKSERYAIWVTLKHVGPWGEVKLSYVNYNTSQGEAKLRILKLTSVVHHLSRVGPKQLCASTPRIYQQSGYFLVFSNTIFPFLLKCLEKLWEEHQSKLNECFQPFGSLYIIYLF